MRMNTPSRAPQCEICGSPPDAGDQRCLSCASPDRTTMPSRAEQRCLAPDGYRQSPTWRAAHGQEIEGSLWLHQSLALEYLEKGQNVVTATGTASGKSLIFQLASLRCIEKDPDAKVIVFYPLKALSHDQLRRWREAARQIGLPPETINNLDGDVDPKDRPSVLKNSRIIVATPDICHAWLLRQSAGHEQKAFLASLAMVIIDESHTYESVFGSNGAYLMRRLATAAAESRGKPPQFCASTATARNPADHLSDLTGLSFVAVEENLNGSPRQEREIFHLPAEPEYSQRIIQMADLVHAILHSTKEAQIIAFADSRQGVERIVAACGRRDVFPYRSGYAQEDRRKIEDGLRDGTVRAVVSTSALELGIDMPDLNYGINLGLPNSRKRFHQRLGRIGRRKPGKFVILEDRYTLLLHGQNLKEYCEQEVEPSRMYLENIYVQKQQAACLRKELSDRQRPYATLPQGTKWPDGFDQVVQQQQSVDRRMHGHEPHLKYGLRSTGDSTQLHLFEQRQNKKKKYIGSITMQQAIREAYPGAVYRHMSQTFLAGGWKRPKKETPYIPLQRLPDNTKDTRPINRRSATVKLTPEGLLDGNLRTLPEGLIAEVRCNIDRSVEGYQFSQKTILYETDDKNGMTRKHLDYDTTGTLLIVNQEWFTGESRSETRKAIAFALRQHLCYRSSTPAGDVEYIWQNVGLDNGSSVTALENAILIYDSIPGGLRLSSDLYHSLDHYGRVISTSVIAEESLEASWVEPTEARKFQTWLNGASANELPTNQSIPKPESPTPLMRVFKTGSKITGTDEHEYLVESCRVSLHPNGQTAVTYQCRRKHGISVELGEAQITRKGQAWNWELHDTATGNVMEMPNV